MLRAACGAGVEMYWWRLRGAVLRAGSAGSGTRHFATVEVKRCDAVSITPGSASALRAAHWVSQKQGFPKQGRVARTQGASVIGITFVTMDVLLASGS